MIEGLALLFGKSSLFKDLEMGLWISFFCWEKKRHLSPKCSLRKKTYINDENNFCMFLFF